MRILVTGAAGFIASHLSEALLAAGDEVVAVDAFVPYYPRAAKERNLADLRDRPGLSFREVDLRTDDLGPCVEGVDAVIHAAAMPGLAQSWVDVETYADCNILAVHRLLEATRAAGVERFLHISTSSVYGTEAVGDETRPTRPISPYGVTKLAAEHLVLAYVELFGLRASILRYFSIYGPRQRPDMAYHRFIEAMLDDRPITVYGDGEQTRSNTFISDCVAGTRQALEGAAVGEIYNIGGGRTISLNEAIETIAEAVGRRPRIDRQPARPGDQRHTSADTSKAGRAFGYRPAIEPRAGLRAQVEWHRGLRRG